MMPGKGDGMMLGKGDPAVPGKGDGKGPLAVKGWPGWEAGRPAWCCKIIVLAESLHDEFPVVPKIVGSNGQNVGHIQSQTKCIVQLRGSKSGHMEPNSNQELQEPMFLWLSADSLQDGEAAKAMALDLLSSVYEEHESWCKTHNLLDKIPGNLSPTVEENPDPPPGRPPAPFHGTGPY